MPPRLTGGMRTARRGAELHTPAVGVAAPTTPPVTSGLVLFLDASQTSYGDGSDVTSWTDLSTSGYVLSPTGTAPVLHTNQTPSGKAAIAFNGASKLKTAGNVLIGIGNGASIFVVAKLAASAPGGYQGIASKAQSGSNNFDLWRRDSDGTVQTQYGGGLTFADTSVPWTDAASFHVLETAYGNAATPGAWTYFDGVRGFTGTTQQAEAEANVPLYVGGRSDDATDLSGQIAALLIYDRMVDESTERAAITSWINARFM